MILFMLKVFIIKEKEKNKKKKKKIKSLAFRLNILYNFYVKMKISKKGGI